MSKVVTPPDIVEEAQVYLVINASTDDVERLIYWLKIQERSCTIHLYHEQMEHAQWAMNVAAVCKNIVINRDTATINLMDSLIDNVSKIRWFGQRQEVKTATEYFVKHG